MSSSRMCESNKVMTYIIVEKVAYKHDISVQHHSFSDYKHSRIHVKDKCITAEISGRLYIYSYSAYSVRSITSILGKKKGARRQRSIFVGRHNRRWFDPQIR
jgi:hypothetical protein